MRLGAVVAEKLSYGPLPQSLSLSPTHFPGPHVKYVVLLFNGHCVAVHSLQPSLTVEILKRYSSRC